MINHYIFLSSSYSHGERIALDFVGLSANESKRLLDAINKIKIKCGRDVAVSLHSVEAQSENWGSVCAADPFFNKVRLIADVDEFIALINNDRKLLGVDIAKYILSAVGKCTHLKLEKLVYFCYADYLCETKGSDRLFQDKIYAYRYGPVIETVYNHYKAYAADEIDYSTPPYEPDIPKREYRLSARSRILFSENGLSRMNSINRTLDKYRNCDVGTLISLTHRANSPWAHCDSESSNYPIDDDLILKYHCVEEL